jgi:hypothetical protein
MYRAGTEGENKCQNSQHPSKRQIDFSHHPSCFGIATDVGLLKDAHGIDLRLAALTRSRADADTFRSKRFEVY